jgi:hypothetical protein
MPDMVHETITLPRRVVELALSCIARAEVEGAFKGCVVGTIGKVTMDRLQLALDEAK